MEYKNSFSIYGTRLKKKLPIEEQKKYLELASKGDQRAKDILFEHNLLLVGKTIQKYFRNESEKEELFQVGSIGLLKAINNFNYNFNIKFSTYAVPMISGEIKTYIRENKTLLHVPRSTYSVSMRIKTLEKEYNRKLSIDEMEKSLKVPKKEIICALNSSINPQSLSEVVFENNTSISRNDFVYDTKFSIDELIEKITLEEAIKKLDYREQTIIKYTFALNEEYKNQTEISLELGLSQAQVSRIYKGALNKLKQFLLDNNIKNGKSKNYCKIL